MFSFFLDNNKMQNNIFSLLKQVVLESNSRIFNRLSSTSIYALASGHNQKCGVAVIRLSGRSSLNVLGKLTNESTASYKPRMMYFKSVWHPVTKEKLDKSLVVYFKGFLFFIFSFN